jgi:hypothetical protein
LKSFGVNGSRPAKTANDEEVAMPRTIYRNPDLEVLTIQEFMAKRFGNRAIDSVTMGELMVVYAAESAKNGGLERDPLVIVTPRVEKLARQFGVPAINLDELEIDQEILALILRDFCVMRTCLPVNRAGDHLIVVVADPDSRFLIDDLKGLTGYQIELVVAEADQIRAAIKRYYGDAPAVAVETFGMSQTKLTEG